jgi:chemotaxis protein MotB
MKDASELLAKVDKSDKHGDAIVKRGGRRHDHEEHGSAWKVAFADFCLALMCLFLLLWVMAAQKTERAEEALRTRGSLLQEGSGRGLESMRNAPGSMISREPLPPGNGPSGSSSIEDLPKKQYNSPAELQQLAQVFKQLAEDAKLSGNLQTAVTPTGLRVMLHDNDKRGVFERGSAIPSENFRRLLRRMGPIFGQIENQLLIVGHTDSIQYADRSEGAFSNWTLSTNRAMAARLYLREGGMPAVSLMQVVGMADRAPLNVDYPAAGMNRRIELIVLTSEHASALASTFGLSREVRPLIEGVDLALPGGEALSALRDRLMPSKGNVAVAR